MSRLFNVCDRLCTANEFAQKYLKVAQCAMKTWYDWKARIRVFHCGDKVLVLLPVHGSPRYCGPCIPLRRK